MTLLRKKTMKDSLFFHKMLQALPKKRKQDVTTHRKNTELSGLTVRGKIVQTRPRANSSL